MKLIVLRFRLILILMISLLVCAPLASQGAPERGSSVPGGFCTVGQDWAGYSPDWIEAGTISGGGQTFYALVDPGEACECTVGFELTTITMYMTFPDETPLPFTLTVSMGLAEVEPNPGGTIPWLPGDTFCETPVREFTSFIPKDFVGFGMAVDCDCLTIAYPYFLLFTIHTVMDELPGGLFTDGSGAPKEGRYLTRIDQQWVDLVAEGTLTRGGLVISGSALCCDLPVVIRQGNWGEIKALYR